MRALLALGLVSALAGCAGHEPLEAAQTRHADIVAAEVRREMGEHWVPTALRIARIESNFRCDAMGPRSKRGERPMGIMQVMPASARSLGHTGPARALLNCRTGAEIGVRHMKRCLQIGATTPALMARCHVSGGITARSRYANKYVELHRKAQP